MTGRLPRELTLLPNLRWRGKLKLIGKEPAGYSVEFDAVCPATNERAQYIVYDRAVLSAKQLEDWTGWSE